MEQIAKHTPGPWEIESDPWHYDTRSIVVAGARNDDHRCIKRQMGVMVGGFAGVDEQEANTRLIAAAPELLDVAIAVREYYERMFSESPVDPDVATQKSEAAYMYAIAGQAISKAIDA